MCNVYFSQQDAWLSLSVVLKHTKVIQTYSIWGASFILTQMWKKNNWIFFRNKFGRAPKIVKGCVYNALKKWRGKKDEIFKALSSTGTEWWDNEYCIILWYQARSRNCGNNGFISQRNVHLHQTYRICSKYTKKKKYIIFLLVTGWNKELATNILWTAATTRTTHSLMSWICFSNIKD